VPTRPGVRWQTSPPTKEGRLHRPRPRPARLEIGPASSAGYPYWIGTITVLWQLGHFIVISLLCRLPVVLTGGVASVVGTLYRVHRVGYNLAVVAGV
jgi:hypothetical protein